MKNIIKCFAWIGLAIMSILLAVNISGFLTGLLFDVHRWDNGYLDLSILVGMAVVGIIMLCFHGIHMHFSKNVIKSEKITRKDVLFLSLIGLIIGGLTYTVTDIMLALSEGYISDIEFNLQGAIIAISSAMGVIIFYSVTVLHGISGTLSRNNSRGGFFTGIVISVPFMILFFGDNIISMCMYTVAMLLMNLIYAKYKNIYCVIFATLVSFILTFIPTIWLQCFVMLVTIIGLVIFFIKNPCYKTFQIKH